MKRAQPAIASCAFEIDQPGTEVQLLPDGLFRADDGRPHDLPGWVLNAKVAAGVLERARARRNDTVIDYEHQTLMLGKAPAAGWFHELAYRKGQGLFITDARWTETARQHLQEKEYRYISAVFTYDPDTGAITRILHAGLTNSPALDGMAEIELAAAAKFFPNHPALAGTPPGEGNYDEDALMNEKLLKLLGLAKDASEDQALASVTALIALKDKLLSALGVPAGADEAAALAAAKAKLAARPDPKQFIEVSVVEALKGELATLKTDLNQREAAGLITAALADGRLLPAQKDWAEQLGRSDLAALKAYCDSAQPIAALTGQQTDKQRPQDDPAPALDEAALAVCKQMGVDPKAYALTLTQEDRA